MDWHRWHDIYEDNAGFKKRLQLVRKHLARCLDRSPPGEVRVISVCAGDGRDLLGALAEHPRRADVRGLLVELDPSLVAQGRNASEALGVAGQVQFVHGDATDPGAYRGAPPANIVMMCGMLGLVGLAELPNIIRTMRVLCAPQGYVVWTRRLDWRDGVRHVRALRRFMAQAGFRHAGLSVTSLGALLCTTAGPSFVVGTHRNGGAPSVLPDGGRLFAVSHGTIGH